MIYVLPPHLVQAESEPDVTTMLDHLGLRDKQQFVSNCFFV